MPTTLYLIRHGATAANLARPNRLQGQCSNEPLAPFGVRQAELTREALAGRDIRHVYASPLLRAAQTASIVAQPHLTTISLVPELLECDVGRWEGLSWEVIARQDQEAYESFLADPAANGYPQGENLRQVAERVQPAFDRIWSEHAGQSVLVVSHHVVARVYLSGVLGLSPSQARQVKLDNCGLSIVVRDGHKTRIAALNDTGHLRSLRAAA
jgi:broad specificity phosphatase PhoE